MNWYAPIERINRWADGLEESFPWLLRYSGIGDPASWYFSHPAFCAAGGALGAVVGLIQGGEAWRAGVIIGWALVAAFYTFVREPRSALESYRAGGLRGALIRPKRNPWGGLVQVGWLVDGFMDCLFCWLYWWFLFLWLAG